MSEPEDVPYGAWYVIDYKTMNNGEYVGMAVAGPFDTREDADAAHTRLGLDGALSIGPRDLGPDWARNLEMWREGTYEETTWDSSDMTK